jgi:hypothetical protein
MRASPPAFYNNFWYTDAVFFEVIAKDTVDGNTTAWVHRVNVLIDLTGLTGTEAGLALDTNRKVVEGDAR